MKRLGIVIGVTATVVTLCSPTVSDAATRARSRAETILNDTSVRISSGFDHTCQVNEDNTVRCWGGNSFGQLGNVSTTPSSSPVLVSGLSNAVAVAAGRFYTCAVLADGRAKCWGANNLGQLGDGTITTNRLTPVAVSGLTNVVAIATGQGHACALLANGTASCWGVNQTGQLGNGGFFIGGVPSQPTPGAVINLSNAVAITAGFFHTCALLANGTAKCWGTNVKGELGNGTFQQTRFGFEVVPVPVVDVSNAVAITAGGAHTCALLADGTAKCWGLDNFGQLGDNPSTDRLADFNFIPLAVVGLNNAVAITAGNAHTCALLADGSAKCWGLNRDGQLGNGNTQTQFVPVAVGLSGDPLRNVVAISTGGHRCFVNSDSLEDFGDFQCAGDFDHTCALLADGSAKCWGSNRSGELGSEVFPGSLAPVTVTGGGGSFTARDIAAGRNHTCAVRANGTVACWGSNDSGQIGSGAIGGNQLSPFTIPNLNNVVGVAAGEAHTCALLADGTAKCWGLNSTGQLGINLPSLQFSASPFNFVSGLFNAVAIAAGGALGSSHTCALIADGTVKCWGANGSGQLGTGGQTPSIVPVPVPGLANAVSIAIGETHTCALVAVGAPFCWGFNGSGQLGTSPTTNPFLPALVSLDNAVAIAGGNLHTCALRADGSTWCWGGNLLGQLGINSTVSQPAHRLVVDPTNAVVTSAVAVAGGFGHTCALVADGTARCWGDNSVGQLGNATLTSSLTPTAVVAQGLLPICGNTRGCTTPKLGKTVAVTTGRRHSCALLATGGVVCWGENTFGQLGIGSTSNRSQPVTVPSFTLNIDPSVVLVHNDRVSTVTILANCEDGQRLHVDVTLTQGAVSGHGVGSGKCTGGLEGYPVTVPAQGRNGFIEGPAQASAEALIREHGEIVEVQEWTRRVQISTVP